MSMDYQADREVREFIDKHMASTKGKEDKTRRIKELVLELNILVNEI